MKTCVHGQGRRRAGYTIFELMIVVAIVGILVAAAGMAWRGQMPRHRVSDTAEKLQAHLRASRTHAISKSRTVDLSLDAAQRRLTTRVDADGSGVIDPGEEATVTLAGAGSVRLTANAATGRYLPSGAFQGAQGFWKITVSHANAADRHVYAFPGGQVQISAEALE